jgi:hypothetical protein
MSGRSAGPVGDACGARAGAARYEAEAAGGAKEGAGEPAQLQAGQLSGVNQAASLSSPSPGARGTADDPGFAGRGEARGRRRVADLVTGAAGHACQAAQAGIGANLFRGPPGPRPRRAARRRPRRCPARPAVVMAGVADQEHPSCPAGRQDRHGWHEQLMPGNGAQPGYVGSGTRLGNPRSGAAGLDHRAPAGSLPGRFCATGPTASGHDIYAQRGMLTRAPSTLPAIAAEHFLSS